MTFDFKKQHKSKNKLTKIKTLNLKIDENYSRFSISIVLIILNKLYYFGNAYKFYTRI